MFRYSALIVPFVLSSCGVINDINDALELEDRAQELEAIVDKADDVQAILDGGEASNTNIEVLTEESISERVGTATYQGFAGWSIPDGNNEIVLTASAEITANFDNDTVETRFSRWLGALIDADGSATGGFGNYDASGNVAFSNGTFQSNGGNFSFEGDVAGELAWRGDDYGIDGRVEGSIATLDGVENIAAGAKNDTIYTINGEPVEGAKFGFGGEIVE
jgi:hypothetical protein